MTCTDTSTPCPSNRTLQITLTDPCQPDITGTVTQAVTDAMTAHKADPDAHPELKQVRRAVTDAGIAYDPTNAAQLSQAITKAVESIDLPLASETVKGIVRLATATEAMAGTQTDTAVHPAGLKAAIAALINGAPGALDTLKELADALGNDANFAATITNALATKAPLASPVLTGTPTAPTAAAGNNSQQIATTAFVRSLFDGLSDRSVIPVGTESLFPGTTPPAGWLVEDGALVSRATYPDLWAFAETSGMIVSDTDWRDVIANRSKFSTGDGSTTFRLPNLITSGLFIRAQDPADADFGRRQEDELKAHNHTIPGTIWDTVSGTQFPNGSGTSGHSSARSTALTGGSETRPKNAGRLPIIKAFSASVTNSVNGGSVDLAAMTSQLESLHSRIDSLPFTHSYQSSEIAFPDTVLTQTLNHGLGAKPKLVQAVLVCKSAEHGFSVGDEVVLHGNYSSDTQYTLMSTNSTASTVTLNIKCSGGFVFAAYPNDSTSTLTKENWNVLIRAWA